MVAELFVDTSFIVAALSRSDRNHTTALALTEALGAAAAVTSNHVLGECWTFVRRRFGHRPAVEVVDAVRRSGRYRVLYAGQPIERAALDWLRERDEREYSFVDSVSFQLMRERGITDALAFDADFEAAGFHTLRP